MTEAEYFETAWHLAGQLQAREHHFQLGRYGLSASFGGTELMAHLTRAIAHLRVNVAAETSFPIRCFDTASTNLQMPSPPWGTRDYLARGAIGGWEAGRFRAQYGLDHHLLSLMDIEQGLGVYWAQRAQPLRVQEPI